MAGVTDSAFRQMCKQGGADVVYSEMASVNALFYSPQKTLEMLKFEETERPYVVQIFGSEPKLFSLATKLIQKELKPDGIDINFGCPVPKIAKQGAGAELMRNLELSKKVVQSVLDASKLPVSIKIRSQVKEMNALRFLDNLSSLSISTLMIHGRNLNQGHSGEVNTKIIRQARNYFGGVILANGGVIDKKSADKLLLESKADGIGVGQGAMGRPWIFKELKGEKIEVDVFEKMKEHFLLAQKNKGQQGAIEMRKHLCWYVNGMTGAGAMRKKFVEVETYEDLLKIID